MKLTRDQLDAMLVDYLYDELDVREKARFEEGLSEHPDLAASVRAQLSTRAAFRKLAVVEPPQRVTDALLRQARAAAVVERKPSWFERLATFFMQPSAAAAMLFLIVLGTSLFLADKQGPEDRQHAMERMEERPPAPPAGPAIASPRPSLDERTVAPAAASGEGGDGAGLIDLEDSLRVGAPKQEGGEPEPVAVAPTPPAPKAVDLDKAPRARPADRRESKKTLGGAESRPVAPQEAEVQRAAPEAGREAAPGPSGPATNTAAGSAAAGLDEGGYYSTPQKQRTTRGLSTVASRPNPEENAAAPAPRRAEDLPAAPTEAERKVEVAKPQVAEPSKVPYQDDKGRDDKGKDDRLADTKKSGAPQPAPAPPAEQAKTKDQTGSGAGDEVKRLSEEFEQAIKVSDLAKARLALAKLEKVASADKAVKEMRARLERAEVAERKASSGSKAVPDKTDKAGSKKATTY